jgi:hypothetical protein
MKSARWIVVALGVGIAAAGCVLTSGQIRIDFDLPNATVSTLTGLEHFTIDLKDKKEFTDNQEHIKGITDLAVLGKFTNNSSGAIQVEVWMTQGSTSYTSESALKADPTALQIWGPFALGAGGSPTAMKVVDWDESSGLFTTAGKAALIDEAKHGDGVFTLYAIGAAGTYNFDIQNGALVLVLDTGI